MWVLKDRLWLIGPVTATGSSLLFSLSLMLPWAVFKKANVDVAVTGLDVVGWPKAALVILAIGVGGLSSWRWSATLVLVTIPGVSLGALLLYRVHGYIVATRRYIDAGDDGFSNPLSSAASRSNLVGVSTDAVSTGVGLFIAVVALALASVALIATFFGDSRRQGASHQRSSVEVAGQGAE